MSSSVLQTTLSNLQQTNYASLVTLTAVAYDYVLTFSKEVEYIWYKRWTWVSFLFVLVRYCGLYGVIELSLVETSFLPGSPEVLMLATLLVSDVYLTNVLTSMHIRCKIMYIVYAWSFILFIAAADLVTILRIWVIYDRSRLILVPFVVFFLMEIVSLILYAVIVANPNAVSVTVTQIWDFTVSSITVQISTTSGIWTMVATTLQIVHGLVMCILVIIKFVRQSLQIYRATNRWQVNQYTKLFVKQGIIYFFALFLFNLTLQLYTLGYSPPAGWASFLFVIAQMVPVFTLTPRFILSVRELYARGGVQWQHVDMDFGFGLSTALRDGTADMAMVFAGPVQDGELVHANDLPMQGIVGETKLAI